MVDEGWSGIDVQLKRRHNLIPNLSAVVKKYAAHESEVFTKLAESRERCMGAGDNVKNLSQAESGISMGLKSILAIAESYPELKSDKNFLEFQNELSDIEDHIQMARRYYNGTTRDLNISIDSFPQNLIANKFNFTKREFFEVEESQKALPKVQELL